jgi:hypothetical protein
VLLSSDTHRKPVTSFIRRWADNIKIDFREIGWDGVDWFDLAEDRDRWRALVNTAESSGSIKCWEVLECLHNWRLFKKGSAP